MVWRQSWVRNADDHPALLCVKFGDDWPTTSVILGLLFDWALSCTWLCRRLSRVHAVISNCQYAGCPRATWEPLIALRNAPLAAAPALLITQSRYIGIVRQLSAKSATPNTVGIRRKFRYTTFSCRNCARPALPVTQKDSTTWKKRILSL